MRLLLLSILPLLVFSSCSKYQCVSVSSGDEMPRNDKNEFIAENDTVRIIYSFADNNGVALINVFNKSNHGLYVDWSKSFLITGESPVSFYKPETTVTGELARPAYGRDNVRFNAMAFTTQELQFIPPQTGITRMGDKLTSGKFFNPKNYSFSTERIRSMGLSKKIERAEISRKNSPLQFRIYLTLVSGDKTDERLMVFDRSFYISGLIQTKADVDDLFPKQRNRNMIRMEKSTTTGTLLKAAGVIGLVALLFKAGRG